jgi:hypothetical protein
VVLILAMSSGDTGKEDVKRIDDTPATTVRRIRDGLKAPPAQRAPGHGEEEETGVMAVLTGRSSQ